MTTSAPTLSSPTRSSSPAKSEATDMTLDIGEYRAKLSPPAEDTPILFNRVPKVTFDFWLIKLMAVTMGETAADYLAVNMGLGLTTTSLIMSAILLVAVFLQFAQKKYVPWAYWLAVVL